MGWDPTVYSWALVGAGVVNLAVVWAVVARREVRAATPFAVMVTGVAVYAFGDAYRLGATTLDSYVQAHLVTVVGYLVVPPAFLLFVIAYSGRERWLDRRLVGLLAVEPLTLLMLTATMGRHSLLWEFESLTRAGGIPVVEWAVGPVYWFHVAYVYALVLVGLGLLVRVAVTRQRAYGRQATAVLAGGLVPLGASLFWLFGYLPVENLDPTPFGFTVTGVVYAVALVRYDLFDVVPVARRTLVEESEDPLVVLDTDDRVADVNPAAGDLFGTDAVGSPVVDLLPALSGPPGDRETVVVEADGSDRYFDCRRTDLHDERGTRIGRLVIFRDVTERHRVRKRYQTLIEQSSDVVGVVDEDATFQYLSPSIESVLGYESDDLVGDPVFEYVHPDDRDRLVEEFASHVDDPGYTNTYEARFRHAHGDWRTLESKARNLLDDPYVDGIVLNSRDITERRRRERQLSAQNERLEEFASVVSHDLRNPLHVLSARVELARETGDVSHLEQVDTAIERMERMIGDVLQLAHRGRTAEETRPVALEDVARRAWGTVDSEGVTLVCETETTVDADPNLLQQLFENFFRNVVEHASVRSRSDTAGYGPEIAPPPVEADDEETEQSVDGADLAGDEPTTVRVGDLSDGFYVADDGPGIPEEKHDTVFEYGVTYSDDGTGLGLAIVSRIVAAHGWEISLTDSDEGGARFEIRT